MTFICNTSDDDLEPYDLGDEDSRGNFDWDRYRKLFDLVAERDDDWQGVPVHIPGLPLRLHDRHPLADGYRSIEGVGIDMLVGGPSLADDEDEECVNRWYSHKRNADVYVFHRKPSGRAFALAAPRSPDGSMDRFLYWMNTLGASDAWQLDAEHKAREKLRSLCTERQWRHYDLTGSFLETSARSNLTYLFRRLRPTVALSPRWPWWREPIDSMRMLAVLCMHPIGHYEASWAGCMVPTDDVIAHLVYMRGDEAGFWKAANQHEPRSPEAGL